MAFEKLTAFLDTLPTLYVPGSDCAVYQDHQQLYRHFVGFRDEKNTIPMDGNETYFLYSCSKVITTCAAMQLIEKGRLYLDAPVAEYLPAFAHMQVMDDGRLRPAQRTMTIRHLMSMTAGLDYNVFASEIKDLNEKTNGQASTQDVINVIATRPLHYEPGDGYIYSLGHDVLAAVIEVASGLKFSDYLRENIFDPLGMKTASFRVTDAIRKRLCARYLFHDDTKELEPVPVEKLMYRLSDHYESGGAGIIADHHDCAVFLDALACGGRSKDGYCVLSPEMIQLWSSNQLGPKSRKIFDQWGIEGYSYGLGVRTRVDLSLGGRGALNEFGWCGAAGSYFCIDPAHHLSIVFNQHVLTHDEISNKEYTTIREMVYEELNL